MKLLRRLEISSGVWPTLRYSLKKHQFPADLDSTGLMLYVLFLIQVQSSTKATWQLMFLQGDGHKTFMSIQEAESLGYIVTSSAHRVVLRTDQRSPHAKVMMVSEPGPKGWCPDGSTHPRSVISTYYELGF